MALDLPASSDLSLIFERDDVHDAFAGHCCRTHLDEDAVRQCEYCTRLRLILANAILEWKAICEQDAQTAPTGFVHKLKPNGLVCAADCYACERAGLQERVKFTADYESLKLQIADAQTAQARITQEPVVGLELALIQQVRERKRLEAQLAERDATITTLQQKLDQHGQTKDTA